MNRRQFLTRAGAAAAVAGIAGCDAVPSPSTKTTRPTSDSDTGEFDEVVTIDEPLDGGSDEHELVPLLDKHAADGRLLVLSEGRYRIGEAWEFPSFDRFGIRGPDATIVPDEGYADVLLALGSPRKAGRILVEGLTFDFRAEETGGRPLWARADEEIVARDLSVVGRQDVDQDMFRFDVTAPDGHGLIERLSIPDGAITGWENTGCEVGDDNRGDLTFADCYVEGFPDNGLYADPPEGRVHVLGGTYRNNGIANVRVNAAAGSTVRGVHVRCDEARDGLDNMRGIRLRGGNDILVDNCLVEMMAVTNSDGAITFASELESATVRNTRVRLDADGVNAVRIKTPAKGARVDGSGPFRCENLVVTGTAAEGAVIHAAERNDCVFDGLCVRQTGAARDGIYTSNVTGSVRNAYIAVTGDAYRFEGSALSTSDLTVTTPDDDGWRNAPLCR